MHYLWNRQSQCECKLCVFQACAEMLQENTSLQCLNIESNFITADGMKAIVKAMANNATLVELKIDNQVRKMKLLGFFFDWSHSVLLFGENRFSSPVRHRGRSWETQLRWRLRPCWRTTPASLNLATTLPSRVPAPEQPWPLRETTIWVRNTWKSFKKSMYNCWKIGPNVALWRFKGSWSITCILQVIFDVFLSSTFIFFSAVRQQRLRWRQKRQSQRKESSKISEPVNMLPQTVSCQLSRCNGPELNALKITWITTQIIQFLFPAAIIL